MKTTPPQSRLAITFRVLAFVLLFAAGLGLLIAVDFEVSRLIDFIRDTDPVGFVTLMSTLLLVGFPISVCYLYAGSAFPWWQAWSLCSLALLINIAIAYPIGRHLLAHPIARLLQYYEKSFPVLTSANQFRITFLVRVLPGIPYFMQNYLLAMIGVKFVHYLLISWLVQSSIAAGMTAVPLLVERTGWATAGILLLILLLLGVLHRVYIPRKKILKEDGSE